MFKTLLTILILGILALALVMGIPTALWFIAYGRETTRGFDSISMHAATTLGAVGMLYTVLLINSIDWVNDWVASRMGANKVTKELVDIARAQANQSRAFAAQSRLDNKQQPQGGFLPDEEDDLMPQLQ